MLTYKFFSSLSRDPHYNYNLKRTVELLVQCKHNKSERIQQAKKLELFYMMHQIIIMHIDIYKGMCARDYDYDEGNSAFQRDDLISEFYMVFERCVKNYKLNLRDKKGKRINFYFYYKKSLIWCIQRIYHLHHKKLQNVDQIGDNDWKYDVQSCESQPDFLDFLMSQWGLTEIQKCIISSKMEGIPIKDYIQQNEMSSGDYYKQLQLIKDKLQKSIYEGNFVYDKFVDSKWFQGLGTGREQQHSIILAGEGLSNAKQE